VQRALYPKASSHRRPPLSAIARFTRDLPPPNRRQPRHRTTSIAVADSRPVRDDPFSHLLTDPFARVIVAWNHRGARELARPTAIVLTTRVWALRSVSGPPRTRGQVVLPSRTRGRCRRWRIRMPKGAVIGSFLSLHVKPLRGKGKLGETAVRCFHSCRRTYREHADPPAYGSNYISF